MRLFVVDGNQLMESQVELNIYVLECEGNKYYVGKTTQSVEQRFSQHIQPTNLCAFTSKFKPVKIVEVIKSSDPLDEDKVTKRYMMKYGIENVRGGAYTKLELEEWQIKSLEHEFACTNDLCLKCGMSGHFANSCKFFELSIEEIEEQINGLEGAKNYLQNIKPTQYLSSKYINETINSPYGNIELRRILLKEHKKFINCSICKSSGERPIGMGNKHGEFGLKCRECNNIFNCNLKSNFKASLEFINMLPKNHKIINYNVIYPNYQLQQTKTDLYKSYVKGIQEENKLNNIVKLYNIVQSDDETIINKIDNLLEILWHQLAKKISESE